MAQIADPSAWLAMFTAGWNDLGQTTFWVASLKIIWINVLLSGDNAVVIAMACRALPYRQRLWGMVLGAAVAVVLRILFTGFVASLMQLPYLKLVGGLALFYIAAKLLVPDDSDDNEVEAVEHLWRAVRIVAVADIIMSLDNVIAIAMAAQGNLALLVLGLGISIPLIVAGAALIMALLDRYPILVWAGAALLGWIVGEVIATDPAVVPGLAHLIDAPATFDVSITSALFGGSTRLAAHVNLVELAMAALGAILVLVVGGAWRASKQAGREAAPVMQPLPHSQQNERRLAEQKQGVPAE